MNGSLGREPKPDKGGWRSVLARWEGASHARNVQGTALVSWVVFFVFLGLYTATLLPDVLPADSGEFQTVAATAGVAHPPGYPLYTMLGWLFSRMPLGPTPAWRVSFFSAVTAAATVALVFSTAWKLTDSVLGGLAAALTLGSATTFWATATKASIRPLTAFFTALCVYALVEHGQKRTVLGGTGGAEGDGVQQGLARRGRRSAGDRYLVLFSLSLSLGLTHHPSLAFPGAVFVVYLLLIDSALLRQPARWLGPVAALLPGLLVLAYLPLRGAPSLATLSGFLDHVLARGFRGDMFALGLLDRSVLLPTLLRFQVNRALLLGMMLGALLLVWRERKLALLLVGSFVLHTMVTLTYDAPQTVEYEMPAYVSLALLMAVPFGCIQVLRSRVRDGESPGSKLNAVFSAMCHVAAIVFLVASMVNLIAHLPSYRSLSRSHDTRAYVQTVLQEAPEGAIILSNWHWFTPLRYVQRIEGARPDVTIEYVAPRGEPLAETWVRSIEEHISRRPVVVVRAFAFEYSAMPYAFEPLGEAFLVRSEPRADVPAGLIALDAVLGGQVEMRGYRVTSEEARPAQPLTVILAWSPAAGDPQPEPTDGVALFAQLIGPDGRLWSTAEDVRHPADTLSAGEVVVNRFVVYPRLQATPGDYNLVVGAYGTGPSSEGRLTTPEGADAVALEAVHLEPSTTRPVTRHPRFVHLAGGPTLIGVDYDVDPSGHVRVYLHWRGPGPATHLHLAGEEDALLTTGQVPALKRGEYATVAVDRPGIPSRLFVPGRGGPRRWNLFSGSIRLPSPRAGERYVPFGDAMVLTGFEGPSEGLEEGGEVRLDLHFSAQRPLDRDYIVSTSLTGVNADGTWAWRDLHDTVPALGAIPTLKWIHGSSVLDPHRVSVPVDAPDVPILGSLLVYDHFTQRSLPNLDERYTPVVELGTWRLTQ